MQSCEAWCENSYHFHLNQRPDVIYVHKLHYSSHRFSALLNKLWSTSIIIERKWFEATAIQCFISCVHFGSVEIIKPWERTSEWERNKRLSFVLIYVKCSRVKQRFIVLIEMSSLKGKSILVTGAGQGAGESFRHLLLFCLVFVIIRQQVLTLKRFDNQNKHFLFSKGSDEIWWRSLWTLEQMSSVCRDQRLR